MLRREFFRNLTLLSGTAILPQTKIFAAENTSRNTRKVSGRVTADGKGIAGVPVSDGHQVVQTARDGSYQLVPHSNARFVFITVPSGYEIPHQQHVASFYHPLNNNAAQKHDFSLKKLAAGDKKHAFIVWGDTQILSDEDAQQLKSISAPDTRAAIEKMKDVPMHGIGCGDLVFDKFELFKDYKEAVAITGIPFFQVIGNHDVDYTSRTDDGSQDTFHAHFGPAYYSFNRATSTTWCWIMFSFLAPAIVTLATSRRASWRGSKTIFLW